GDAETAAAKPYSLACAVCFWDSRAIGWAFEKPTGISAQIERLRGRGSRAEYAGLLEHWRAVQRAAALKAQAPAGYVAGEYDDTDHVQVTQRMAVENADFAASTAEQAEPQRVRLHMKLARRCRQCHHILIKPESKAQLTRFKIQLVAMHFLPRILVAHAPGLRAGTTAPVVLRFANPLYTDMHVQVACHADSAVAMVGIMKQQFTLPPFTELWEYDDDDDEAGPMRSELLASAQDGVVEKHGNRIAILVKVAAVEKTDCLVLPLLVTCSHVDDMDQV
ncbi:hypothetical protein EC988_008834, partial [Linderina pennispora]